MTRFPRGYNTPLLPVTARGGAPRCQIGARALSFVPVYRSHTGGKQMRLKPLGARTLVKMIEREEQTASGIVLPDTARQKPQTAEVVAVGASDEVKVGVGDVVVLAKYSGTEVKVDGEDHLIVDTDDILGVVEG